MRDSSVAQVCVAVRFVLGRDKQPRLRLAPIPGGAERQGKSRPVVPAGQRWSRQPFPINLGMGLILVHCMRPAHRIATGSSVAAPPSIRGTGTIVPIGQGHEETVDEAAIMGPDGKPIHDTAKMDLVSRANMNQRAICM